MERSGTRRWRRRSSTTSTAKDSGSRTGSWDPIDRWGDDGGRVYSTAVLAMCLEVYYRYDKVFGGGTATVRK